MNVSPDQPPAKFWPRIPRLTRAALAVVSVFVILLFIVSAVHRVRCSYELEQNESYMVLSVTHMAHGGSLYPEPSFAFLANMYPPGYYYAALALAKITGSVSSATLRGVSILSTLGCFAMIFLLIWSETRRWLPALAGAALYAGAYPICEAWFDIGRLDSFYVFLILVALYCTRRFHPVIAALAWILAVQTKQPILPVALILLCFDYKRIGRTAAGLITFFAGLAATVIALNHSTRAWYSLYIFKEPASNAGLILRPGALFLFDNLFHPFGIACLMVIAAALLTRPRFTSEATRFYLASLSIILLTWYQMMHAGSAVNILMPAYALLAVLFGIALARLWVFFASQGPGGIPEVLLMAAALIQIAAGIYNPGAYKVQPAKVAALNALTAQLKSIPGDVYIPQHTYYAVLAGKPEHPDDIALKETLSALSPARADALRHEVLGALCDGSIHALVFNAPDDIDEFASTIKAGPGLRQHYAAPQMIPGAEPDSKPAWILMAKDADAASTASCTAETY